MKLPASLTRLAPGVLLGLVLLTACGGGGGGAGNPGGGGNPTVAPAITAQPSDAVVTLGLGAAFTVSASGTPAPAFQWERSPDGNAWQDIPGATAASLAFNPMKADHAARFRARASNTAGTATSSAALLSVRWAPAFTLQPTPQAVLAPAPATFSAQADANPAATLQWQTSAGAGVWTDQPGATSAAFQTGPTSAAMNNLQVRCVATNPVGSATSQGVTLLVNVPSFTLTVSLGAGTAGTPAATGLHAAGTPVAYAYSALAGFTNLQVLIDGIPGSASGVLTMNADHALAASATPIPRTVTFAAGVGGSLGGSTSQTVPHGGSTSPVTALPDNGFVFVNWTGAGFATTSANPLSLANVTQDYALTAHFNAVPVLLPLAVSLGPGVAGTPASGGTFVQGTVVPYSYTTQSGFTNLAVKLDGTPVAAAGSVTMDTAHTLSATAEADPTPTIEVGQAGAIFSPDALTVKAGTPVRFRWASSGHSVVIGNPCSPSGVLDSGIRSAGFELLFTPAGPGDVPFFCSPHCGVGMTGVLHVIP